MIQNEPLEQAADTHQYDSHLLYSQGWSVYVHNYFHTITPKNHQSQH